MKKIIICFLIVLLLCLGFAPVLAQSPYVAAISPAEKSSLAPFIHVRDSTVGNLYDGIGYVDSVVTINGGMLEANYTNTTEIQNTAFTNRILRYISFYGSSHITINNTNMSSTNLYVYGSSQVTLINSTFAGMYAYESTEVTINNSTIDYATLYGNSRVSINNSNITLISLNVHGNSRVSINNSNITSWGMAFYDDSRVYASESQLLLLGDPLNNYIALLDNSYLNASNCTIDVLKAFDFSTGQITNNSTIDEFMSYDAADFSVDNSTIPVIEYGLVCTVGSLTINGSNPAVGLGNCRNTTTPINGNYDPTPSLVSIGALASSSVNITNNNSITRVFATGSSQVYLENDTELTRIICTDYSTTVFKNTDVNGACWFECMGYSNLTLDNIDTPPGNMILNLYDQSNATFRNTILTNVPLSISVYNQSTLHIENIETTRHLWIYSHDSSVVHVENVTMSGSFPPALEIGSYDSSAVDVVNVTIVSPASSKFYGYDLSTMTINSSNITIVGYAVKSAGDFSVTGGVPSGAYTNTTTWNNPKSLGTVTLSSIAVVGTDTVTITDSNLGANLYLHDNANLNIQNSTISKRVYVYDSSTVNGTNTTFADIVIYDQSSASLSNTTFQYSILYDQSGASLSNVTVNSGVQVYDSAALTCTGTPSAPSTIYRVYAESNYPDMANVQINNCTVTYVYGATWITLQAPALGYTPLLLLLNYYSSSQSQQFTFTLLVLGGVVAAIVAAAAVILWRRRA